MLNINKAPFRCATHYVNVMDLTCWSACDSLLDKSHNNFTWLNLVRVPFNVKAPAAQG